MYYSQYIVTNFCGMKAFDAQVRRLSDRKKRRSLSLALSCMKLNTNTIPMESPMER